MRISQMAFVSAAVAGVFAVGALALAQDAPYAITDPDINNGRFVATGGFADPDIGGQSAACMHCHGMDGAGDSTGAFPRLAGQSGWYLYKSLRDYASGARPHDVMTPIAQAMTDAEMQDVSAYYASITDAPDPPMIEVDPMALQRGATLSAIGSQQDNVQACANCHGPAGQGVPPVFPYLAGQPASYTELQLQRWRDGVRDTDPMGVMEIIARNMSDEDIRAVALYFQNVRPAGGGGGRRPGEDIAGPSPFDTPESETLPQDAETPDDVQDLLPDQTTEGNGDQPLEE